MNVCTGAKYYYNIGWHIYLVMGRWDQDSPTVAFQTFSDSDGFRMSPNLMVSDHTLSPAAAALLSQ